MRKIKSILGVAVALAMTAAGAFAQTVITQLPATIQDPGSYVLDPAVEGQVIVEPWAIEITATGVDLNLNNLMVKCQNGIYIHNGANGPVSAVTVHDGTIVNVGSQLPPVGIFINGLVSGVNITGVTFAGENSQIATSGTDARFDGYANNVDNGSGTTYKSCAFFGRLILNGDHATVMKSNFTGNAFYILIQNPVLSSDGAGNSFKLNTVSAGAVGSGTVQLGGTDTHQNNILTGGATIVGGRQLGSQP